MELAINWGLDPAIFHEPFEIRWYGLCWALAFFIGYRLTRKVFLKESVDLAKLDKLLLYAMVGTILGARLGHVFFYDWPTYAADPIQILNLRGGGLASHGGAIGVVLALWLFSRRVKDLSIMWCLDRVVIAVAMAAFLIRVGNFANHEIVGIPTDLPWAVIFERYVDQLPRHPAQLYEAIFYLVLFFLLNHLYYKKGFGQAKGLLFGIYLVGTFTARFIVEFVKVKQTDATTDWALNMGHILSIPLILVGLYFVYRGLQNRKALSA